MAIRLDLFRKRMNWGNCGKTKQQQKAKFTIYFQNQYCSGFSLVVVVQWLSCVRLFATPWNIALQTSPSFTISRSLLKLTSIQSVMPSHRLILCHLLLFLHSIFPSTRVFSNESALSIIWPKYWSFSFSVSPSNEYSGLISFRIDWFGLLAVQETLKSLLQHHQFKSINSLVSSLLYGPTLTPIHDYWENHSFHYMDLCQQSDVSVFYLVLLVLYLYNIPSRVPN